MTSLRGISKEQRVRDEKALARFLVAFNLILFAALIVTCVVVEP